MRRRGGRGAPSDLPSVAEAYLMVDQVLSSEAPIMRALLEYLFGSHNASGRKRVIRDFAGAFYGQGGSHAERFHRRLRMQLADSAIEELGL